MVQSALSCTVKTQEICFVGDIAEPIELGCLVQYLKRLTLFKIDHSICRVNFRKKVRQN
jgi:hypothetical protein